LAILHSPDTRNPHQCTLTHLYPNPTTSATMAFGLKSKFRPTQVSQPCHDPPLSISQILGSMSVPVHQLLNTFINTMPLFDPRTHPAAVILLAFVLAAGFLLVILSCALWNNWLPLLVGTSHFSIHHSPYSTIPTLPVGDYQGRWREEGRERERADE